VPLVQKYILGLLNGGLSADAVPAVAPAANVKYALFAQPLQTCDHFGLLSAEVATSCTPPYTLTTL
jgi:hypothetical protein